uniref:Peptidase S74 domain-containing protein n=1 Tax=viral metagenome TaxID=1070528 RepID=A0A6C0CEJ9_9ZZZZ
MSQSTIKISTVLNSKLSSNGGTMTGALTYNTTTGNNPILISSSLTTANNAIQFINNDNKTAYIGLGATSMSGGGYYCSNLYFESTAAYGGMIFNTGGNVGTNVPRMIITSNGNIGIGITNPSTTLTTNGSITILGSTTNNLIFDNNLNNYKIQLYTGNGFGVNSSGLMHISSGAHLFYNSSSLTTVLASISPSGDLTLGGTIYAGNISTGGKMVLGNGVWHNSADGVNRFFFDTNGKTYFHQGGNAGYVFRNTAQGDVFTITDSGNILVANAALITATSLDFSNGGVNSFQGSIYLGAGSWHSGNYNSIYTDCGANASTYCRLVFTNYNAGSPGGFYFSQGNGAGGLSVNTIPNPSYSISTGYSCYFSATSYPCDRRIKKNISNVNEANGLEKILSLKAVKYNYIDEKKGKNDVYGFISQDVIKIIPEAVEIKDEYIPNIYTNATYVDNIVYFDDNVDISILNINTEIKIDANDETEYYKIIDKTSNSIKLDNNIKLNQRKQPNTSNCFIYGTNINDFHTLNKDYIFTLNVSATQELYKIIQQQQEQINKLIIEVENLKK